MAHSHVTITAYVCMDSLEILATEMTSDGSTRWWRQLGHTCQPLPASGRADEAWMTEAIGTWLWALSNTLRDAAF